MKKLFLILPFITICFYGFNQFTVGFGYAGTLPLGVFNQEGYQFGNGFDFHILTGPFPSETNYRFQLGFDFNNFNCESRSGVYSFIRDGNIYRSNQKFTNGHVAFGLKFRLLKEDEKFRHHVDIDYGNRSFSTLREVNNITPTNQILYSPVSTVNLSNNSFLGITLGSMYKLTNWLFIDLYTRVDFGKSAEWYDLNSLRNINDRILCDEKTTKTPLLWFGANLSFQLNFKKTNSNVYTYPEENHRNYPPTIENPRERVIEQNENRTNESESENKTSIFKSIWKIITIIDGVVPKKEKERKPVNSN